MNENEYIQEYVEETKKVLDEMVKTQTNAIRTVAHILRRAQIEGHFIYIMGNGGSSATASHMASDLNKTAGAYGGKGFKAICLTDNTPLFTAFANDTAYGMVFDQQLVNFVEAGDVVIGISGSGNSSNVWRGLDYANNMKATTVGITAGTGGMVRMHALFNIIVPSENMQYIEDVHMLVVHLLASMLRDGID